MRSRVFIITAATLTLLFAAVGGLYAYDRSGSDTIPAGVTMAGIPLGGLDADEARAKLQREYLPELRKPIRVYHGEQTFVLTPEQSEVAANLDVVVDQAMAEAKEGNLFTRSFRRLTGGEVDADLEPDTTYNKGRVVQFLDSIRKGVDRDPIDAKVEIGSDGVVIQESRIGLEVRASELHQKIRLAVVDPSADHTLVAHTEHTEPEVTTDRLADEYETALVVDRANFQLKLYKKLKLVKTYNVGLGMAGRETPSGEYSIANKAINPAWTKPYSDWVPEAEQGTVVPGGVPENPLKSRWMGIYDGVGIHGIDPSLYGTIGTAASHGCVRMRIEEVEELYEEVPVGAPVFIA
jgi:lipoprotein-anchoring transpeptidase ErfK/SrfK